MVGSTNLGALDWTGLAGGPPLIYLVRTVLNAYFTFRVDKLEARLKSQQTERAKIIKKLKDATKYDTTLELLEKYGEEKPKTKGTKSGLAGDGEEQKRAQNKKGGRQSTGPGAGRINIPPPATANIQMPPSAHGTPQSQQRQAQTSSRPQSAHSAQRDTNAEFAPNAEDIQPSYHQYDFNSGPPRWYDRVLDLMMGDDETAPKNRVVLICQNCRLVNGQAPPGTKSLSDIGQWKCMSCGTMNGEMDEAKKIVREVLGSGQTDAAHDISEHGSNTSEDDSAVDQAPVGKEKDLKAVRRSGRNKSQMVP